MFQEDWQRIPPTTAMMTISPKPAKEPTCTQQTLYSNPVQNLSLDKPVQNINLKWSKMQPIPTLRTFFATLGHLRLKYIPTAIGIRRAARVIPVDTHISYYHMHFQDYTFNIKYIFIFILYNFIFTNVIMLQNHTITLHGHVKHLSTAQFLHMHGLSIHHDLSTDQYYHMGSGWYQWRSRQRCK